MMRRSMHSLARTPARLVVCLCLGAAASTLVAQQPAEEELSDAEVRAQMRVVLREHDRIRHPDGEPMRFVGNEQEGNDLRSPTPALANSDRAPALYDEDELRDRTLALYDDNATFTRPPRPVEPLHKPLLAKTKPARRAPDSPEPTEKGASLWWIPVVGGAALGLFLYARARLRS
jgi:hypothetical protein